jgi:tRNA pseudouridine13 synthase
MPLLRQVPQDFVVEELPLYPAKGEGGHTFLLVEKRGVTSEGVARALARLARAAPRDVGYAGRKDRHAVARQWFSAPGLDPERALELELPGARVLQAVRHPHKLRTGHLAGNRFDLRVREVSSEAIAAAPAAGEALASAGLPNRFGVQRFGRRGDNAERGRALLAGGRIGRDRRAARFWLSALQAEVFNAVLDERPIPPGRLERGDVAVVHASGGLFLVEASAHEQPRADAFEISPTGPIFGTKISVEPAGAPARRERQVLARLGIPDPLLPPPGVRLHGTRRPLRVQPREVEVHGEEGSLRLRFVLPSGSYATVFVDALLAAVGAEPARVVVE